MYAVNIDELMVHCATNTLCPATHTSSRRPRASAAAAFWCRLLHVIRIPGDPAAKPRRDFC